MFRGSIPNIVARIADEHARSWDTKTLYVGCSGNFTVERHLGKYGFEIHSSDVLLYSAAIGHWMAGDPMELKLTEYGHEIVPWLEPYLADPDSALAALLVMSAIAKTIGRGDEVPYYKHLQNEYVAQFPRLHRGALDGLRANTTRISSYTSEDVTTWLDRVPADAAVVAYPPFQATGAAQYFARDFAKLERIFQWDPPPYAELEAESLMKVYEKIADRSRWLFATNRAVPFLSDHLRAEVQTSNRSPRIRVYGSHGPVRIVRPHQSVEPLASPHLSPTVELGDRITLVILTASQFQSLRSKYMNAGIRPGQADLGVGVLVDGNLVGAFAYSFAPTFADWHSKLPGPHAYLLSDFPVSGSQYSRLSKLIVAAAISKEAHQLCLIHGRGRPYRSMTTTAFSNNPQSMKYRGILRLLHREENDAFHSSYADNLPEGDTYYGRRWALQYGQLLGEKTLAEHFTEWKQRHMEKQS